MVDGDRPKWRAIDRNEQRMLSHRDISSRSEKLSACLARHRSGGRMPPVGEITEKTKRTPGQTGARSNSSARRLASDPISRTAERPSNKYDVAVSCPHSIFAKRLECCADQLSPPRNAASHGHVRSRRQNGHATAMGSGLSLTLDVWSGRALQEVRRSGGKRSCINVSGL